MKCVVKKFSRHLSPEETDVWRRYHKRGCGLFTRCKLDQISLDIDTTKRHKLGILDAATEAIKKDQHFITEAVPNDRERRRVDFVNLTLDQEVEFETKKSIKKEGAKTVYV